MSDRRRTKTEERNLALAIEDLEMLEIEMQLFKKMDRLMPPGWSLAESDAPTTPKKEKITLRLDADLLQWYRHLGHGYQARINFVLRSYMEAVLSKLIDGRGDRGWRGNLL